VNQLGKKNNDNWNQKPKKSEELRDNHKKKKYDLFDLNKAEKEYNWTEYDNSEQVWYETNRTGNSKKSIRVIKQKNTNFPKLKKTVTFIEEDITLPDNSIKEIRIVEESYILPKTNKKIKSSVSRKVTIKSKNPSLSRPIKNRNVSRK